MRRFLLVPLPFVLTLILACSSAPPPPPEEGGEPPAEWLRDVTEESGIRFQHDAGPTGTYSMPQQVGSGAAAFDADGDGKLDILLLQNGGPEGAKNALYLQTADGTFRDASAGSGLAFAGFNMGAAVGDANDDGRPDVCITQYTGVKFFKNLGGGKFEDVTKASGVNNPAWSTSAAFFDYDRDGRLDLFVTSYVDYDPTWACTGPSGTRDYCAPKTFKGRVSRLFRNTGEGGTIRYQDVTESSGIAQLPGPGLGVACADFDGDGWPDIFVANDGAANRLWMNLRNGTFRDEAVARGIALNGMGVAQAGMGIALGDVDGDGLFDVFVTHLTEETHTLWKQGPRGLFNDATAAAGLVGPSSRSTGFGTLLADFDQDGTLDLAMVNGRVSAMPKAEDQSLGPFWSAYGDRNLILRGEGGGKFRDVSKGSPGFHGLTVSRGLVRGDFDGDGAPDLLVTSVANKARLYRNVAPGRGHWLAVRAIDPQRNRDAIGAEIRVTAGGRSWLGLFNPCESYLCSNEPVTRFGLGSSATYDSIEVKWPDGTSQTFPGGACDRIVKLELKRK